MGTPSGTDTEIAHGELRGTRRLLCSLAAELACDARGAEKEDPVLVLIVIGSNEVAVPAYGVLIRLALAFRTDQRLPHVRTLVHTADGGKMSMRDASSTRSRRASNSNNDG